MAHRWLAALVALVACDGTTATGQETAGGAASADTDGAGSDDEAVPEDASPSSDADPVEPSPETAAAGVAPGDPDVLVGAFQVELVAPVADTPGTTSLLGKVFDGPTPSGVLYRAAEAVGDCTLWIPEVPFCADGCAGGAVCVDADTCRDHPEVLDVGAVTVTGLRTATGVGTISMSPIAGTYQALGPSLPFPAFHEGDAITINAAGSAIAPFTLTTRGIAPLTLTLDAPIVARDTPLALTWTAPGDPTIARVDVKLDISHHGGTKGVIRCATGDDGTVTIDAALITALVDLGYAGMPTVVVTRRAIGSAVTELGRVDLEVSSAVEAAVDIPGLVSCTEDAHCPDGQACRPDRRCE